MLFRSDATMGPAGSNLAELVGPPGPDGMPAEVYKALAPQLAPVLGGVLATYWLNVLWGMGTQLYWEKQQGQLQLYFVAPCSRMAILAGMALGGLIVDLRLRVHPIRHLPPTRPGAEH